MHPSDDPNNEDLVIEIQMVATRILAALKLLNPKDYKVVWENRETLRTPVVGYTECYAETGRLGLRCSDTGWVTAVDLLLPSRTLFHAWIGNGPLEYDWDTDVARKLIMPELRRVLILEDVARI